MLSVSNGSVLQCVMTTAGWRRRLALAVPVAILALCGAGAALARASTFTIPPTGDATVSSAHPATNYGSAKTLSESWGGYHAYLQFKLPVLDGPIQSATLQVYSQSTNSSFGIL